MNKIRNNQKGVVQLVLLLFVFVALILVIVAFIVFNPRFSFIKEMMGSLQKGESAASPTVTSAATTDLEKEVNDQELTDPSTDFTQVDQDINSL